MSFESSELYACIFVLFDLNRVTLNASAVSCVSLSSMGVPGNLQECKTQELIITNEETGIQKCVAGEVLLATR